MYVITHADVCVMKIRYSFNVLWALNESLCVRVRACVRACVSVRALLSVHL